MADWNRYKITNVGTSLIAEAQAQGLALTFTNLKTSSHDYSGATLETLTALEDVEQTFALSEKSNENNKVKLTANLDNTSLTDGYTFNTYGLYANIGGADVLVFVATCINPDEVPSGSASAWQTIINSYLTISNDVNVTINVDLSANATQQYVQDYVKSKLESETIVTIPADDPTDSPYTEETDSHSNTFYTIEIPVTGVTSSYKGARDGKPVYPRPYDVEGKAAIDELFALIQDADSLEGKIKLYFNEKPDTQFQIYLYGV